MSLVKLLFLSLTVFLASCAGTYVESISNLKIEDENDNEGDEYNYVYAVNKTEKPKINNKKIRTLQYIQFSYLFEVISNEDMRREGMRGLMELEFNSDQSGNKNNVSLNDVVDLFESLLNKYPDQLNDRLLYQLARAYEENDQEDAELKTLDRIVKEYPVSEFINDVNYRRGEILFYKKDFEKAIFAYQAVINGKSHPELYEQAIYRLAWSQFKMNRYEQAVSTFLKLIDRKVVDNVLDINAMSDKERIFVEDVFRAISLNFSYQAGAYSAGDYFDKYKKRSYEDLIFKYMAQFYLKKKRYVEAVNSYQVFVKRNGNHIRSPEYLTNVINIYSTGGFSSSLIAAKKDFVQRYGIKTSFWKNKDKSDHKLVVAALNENLLELINYYHAKAQKTRSKLYYREAQRWYRMFLESFPDDLKAASMSFLFAELLFEDKKYSEAVLQYEHSAYDFDQHDKSSEAAYAALLTYIKYEDKLKGKEKIEWHRRFINSSLRFVDKFPKHVQANNVLIQTAENLYAIGELEKSYKAAKQVVSVTNNKKHNRSAFILAGLIEYEWDDYHNAELSYNKALEITASNSKGYKNILEKQALAVYKQGEVSKNKGDLKLAVKHFSRIKSMQPASSIVVNAEYDAAAILISLRDWVKAAVVLEELRKTHPKHKLQPDITKKLSLVYIEAGFTHKAAAEYEKISKLPGAAEYQLEALWQSAELYEQANDLKKAKDSYKKFNKRFSSYVDRVVEARQRLVDLYHREKNYKSSNYWRKKIISADRKAGKAATERMHYLAAKASFSLAEPYYESYMKSQLNIPLKRSLIVKKKKMIRAIKAYGRSAAYNVPEVLTASTFRIAEIYQDLGLAIFHSEKPKKLKGDELEQYTYLIEDLAYPFEEKAIEFHEINIKRIAEGYYDVWVKKSLAYLKELLPVRYVKEERGYQVVKDIL